MELEVWSWLLTYSGALTGWLAGRGSPWAWPVGLGCQGLWTIYSLQTGQEGFLGAVVVYGSVYAYNWWSSLRDVPVGTAGRGCAHCAPLALPTVRRFARALRPRWSRRGALSPAAP